MASSASSQCTPSVAPAGNNIVRQVALPDVDYDNALATLRRGQPYYVYDRQNQSEELIYNVATNEIYEKGTRYRVCKLSDVSGTHCAVQTDTTTQLPDDGTQSTKPVSTWGRLMLKYKRVQWSNNEFAVFMDDDTAAIYSKPLGTAHEGAHEEVMPLICLLMQSCG